MEEGKRVPNSTYRYFLIVGILLVFLGAILSIYFSNRNNYVEETRIFRFDRSTIEMALYGSYKLDYDESKSSGKITWKTSNPEMATVDENGVISAKSEGRVVVIAEHENGERATCNVTIKAGLPNGNVEVSNITLSKEDAVLNIDNTLKLNYKIEPVNANNQTVTWSSSNPSIATVDSNGLVTAKSQGTVDVIAKTNNGKTAISKITVKEKTETKVIEVTEVIISRLEAALNIGDTLKLNYKVEPSNATNQMVTWSSSNPNIVTVDSNGLVTAKDSGIAKITAKSSNGKIAVCNIEVKVVEATSITLNQVIANLTVGDTIRLNYTILPSNTKNKTVYWTSSNTSVVAVDSNGTVTARGVGNAKITVKTSNGKTAVCDVTVTPLDPTSISLSQNSLSLNIGDTSKLSYTITPSNAKNQSVTWSSSNTNVATVDSTGLVTAKSAGTVKITVKTSNGKTATTDITVVNSTTVSKEEKMYFIKTGIDTGRGDAIILSSNGKYALIDTFTKDKCDNLKKFISSKKIKELEFLLITHFHNDHSGCASTIAKTVKINRIYYKAPNPNTKNYSSALNNYNTVMKIDAVKSEFTSDTDLYFQNFKLHIYNTTHRVVGANANKGDDNHESLVIYATNNNHTALLAGDIQEFSNDKYFTGIVNEVGKVELYKTSHHGITDNNPKRLLSILKPTYSVITMTVTYHEDIQQTIKDLKSVGSKVYITANGTVTANFAGSSLKVSQ